MRLAFLGLVFALAWPARAGTTVIHVDTEDGGTITSVGGVVENTKGAIFWNGSTWVTNDTAAHMYFTNIDTGERLMDYATTLLQGNTPETISPLPGIQVTRSLYTYQKAVPGGALQFNGVQYRFSAGGMNVALRSRGAAVGSSSTYFDVYLENADGTSTSAFRGDPVWFLYPMSMTHALAQTSPTAYRRGELPTVGARYFVDLNGGSDMGGFTYELETGALPGADPVIGLGSSFPVRFSYKFMASDNTLQELRFLPYANGVFLANAPTPTPLPPTALLVLTGLAGAAVHQFRKRRSKA